MKKKLTKNKGITLIALVITIIILLILAGISISSLTGSGLFQKAEDAKNKNQNSTVEEEIKLAISEIQMEAITNNKQLSLNDLADANSIYALEKVCEIEWIDKDSNPLLVKKDEVYCFIYDDFSIEVTRNNETYSINTNLNNCTMTNKKTRVPIESSWESKLIEEKFYIIETVIIKMGETDITADVYNVDTKTISIEKLTDNLTIEVTTKAELNNEQALINMIDKTGKYETIEKLLEDEEMVNKIIEDEKAFDYVLESSESILPVVISNAETFEAIANNENAFSKVCENAQARLSMYENYEITESIIANSTIAMNAMMKSTRYQVVNRYGSFSASSELWNKLYDDKVFILGVSQTRDANGSYYTWLRNILSQNGGSIHVGANSSYGTSGLNWRVNKFASDLDMNPYYRAGGAAVGGGLNLYAAIFKI